MARLTIGVRPEDDREKKKRGPKGGAESRDDNEVDQQVARLRQNVVNSEGGGEAQQGSKCARGRAYVDGSITTMKPTRSLVHEGCGAGYGGLDKVYSVLDQRSYVWTVCIE